MKNLSSFNFKLQKDEDEGKWIPSFQRDWAIIVCSSFVAGILVFSFGTYLYFSVVSDTYFSSQSGSASGISVKIRQKELDKVIENFQNKQKNYDVIINNPTKMTDPAIGNAVALAM